MKTVTLILWLSVFVIPARAGECNIDIGGETHALEHVYALRIPDPFDDTVRITRLICTRVPFTEAQLADAASLVAAFHADGQQGVYIDFRDDGAAIAVRLSWGEWSTMWSSSEIAEIAFEGAAGAAQFAGTITTEPALSVFRKDVSWRVTARVELTPVAAW